MHSWSLPLRVNNVQPYPKNSLEAEFWFIALFLRKKVFLSSHGWLSFKICVILSFFSSKKVQKIQKIDFPQKCSKGGYMILDGYQSVLRHPKHVFHRPWVILGHCEIFSKIENFDCIHHFLTQISCIGPQNDLQTEV